MVFLQPLPAPPVSFTTGSGCDDGTTASTYIATIESEQKELDDDGTTDMILFENEENNEYMSEIKAKPTKTRMVRFQIGI